MKRPDPSKLVVVVLGLVAACSPSGGSGPQTQCSGVDGGVCFSGTAVVQGFTATPVALQANLFREFPSTGAVALASVPVGADGSFVFTDVQPWAHFYVQIQADFGLPLAPAAFVGPLTVPPAAPLAPIQVKPVQLSVQEEGPAGSPMMLQSALAYVFDPTSGALLQGATVSIEVGGSAVPMTWTSVGSGNYAYSVTLPANTAAQGTYTITTQGPGATTPSSWQLVAATPTFTPTLTSPAANATVPASQALTVSWPLQPAADDELVQLFVMQNGAWSPVYQPPPDDEDVGQQVIPASYLSPAGQALLLNVAFLQGNCPVTADGCVVAESIAATQITPQ